MQGDRDSGDQEMAPMPAWDGVRSTEASASPGLSHPFQYRIPPRRPPRPVGYLLLSF